MIAFERTVRFEDVDPAQIVFFARYLSYAHEAMEHFFGGLAGGYAALVGERRVGMPAVHVETSFHAPLRYGDAARIETSIARLGRRSAVLLYRIFRKRDGALAAEVRHTVVCSDLSILASCDMPGDVRALFEAHVEPAG
ncbi:MAG: thioesterase family protein [Polyangiaceae bacterium]